MTHKIAALLLTLCLCSLFSQAQLINWQFENISDDIRESGANPNMEIDGLGNIHVAYWKRHLDKLVYGRRDKNTGRWSFQEVPDQGTFGYQSSLKIDATGKVYIAYLANLGGQAALRLATYDGTNWTFEDASEGNTIGSYGYDASFPTLIQPSLDLNFDAFGQPSILHFNGFYTRIKDCAIDLNIDEIYSQYRMDLNIYVRRGPNAWEEVQFPEVPYLGSQPCVENGDRFGEHCKFLRPNDSTWLAITTSMHNNQLLLYRSNDDSLKVWNKYVIDETPRLLSILNQHFYETLAYIDAKVTNDSTIHLTYNLSNHFGYARRVFLGRLTYFYTRVNLNQLDNPGYTPYYFNFTPTTLAAFDNTISVKDDSTIMLAYFDRLKSLAVSAYSTDGGQTWDQDTLTGFITNTSLQSEAVGDSVFIVGYFPPGDRLMMAKRAFDDTDWIIEDVTQTQTTGEFLTSQVVDDNGNRKVYVATQAAETDRLLFGENVAGTWNFETVDQSGGGIGEVDMAIDAQGTIYLCYIATDSTEIRLASKSQGGTWDLSVITDTLLAKDINFLEDNGNLHVTFFSLNGGYLEHFFKASGQSNWTSTIVDSSNNIVGSSADAILDENGGVHVSYIDLIENDVKYAFRATNGSWTTRLLKEDMGIFLPKNTAIALDTLSNPVIAFTDGQKDTIFLATTLDGNNWEIDRLEGEYTDFSGDALGLIVDEQNQPWVLYNFKTVIEDLRFYYRKPAGDWQQVSILSNSAEISNVFSLHRTGKDLYIIGRKNQPNNGGLGLLFAEDGILADITEAESEAGIRILPNPSKGLLSIQWEKSLPRGAEMEVYNLSGQQLYSTSVAGINKGDKIQLDLSSHPQGVYILRIKEENAVHTARLMVIR